MQPTGPSMLCGLSWWSPWMSTGRTFAWLWGWALRGCPTLCSGTCAPLVELWPALVDVVSEAQDVEALQALLREIHSQIGTPTVAPAWKKTLKCHMHGDGAAPHLRVPAPALSVPMPTLAPQPPGLPLGGPPFVPSFQHTRGLPGWGQPAFLPMSRGVVGLRLWGHQEVPLDALRTALEAYLCTDLGVDGAAWRFTSWMQGKMDRQVWQQVSAGQPEVLIPIGGSIVHITHLLS